MSAKDELKKQAMLRSMVQTNHHRSQGISGNIHDEDAFFHNRQEVHQRDMEARMEGLLMLQNNNLPVPKSLHDAVDADIRKILEHRRCGTVKYDPQPQQQPLSQTDAAAIITPEGEKRPAAGYPFKDEVVVSLEHYEKTVAELAAARYEVTKLKQKVNDLTNALSTARDAAADIARDKGHLERRIGELVVEAEHYKARLKR